MRGLKELRRLGGLTELRELKGDDKFEKVETVAGVEKVRRSG